MLYQVQHKQQYHYHLIQCVINLYSFKYQPLENNCIDFDQIIQKQQKNIIVVGWIRSSNQALSPYYPIKSAQILPVLYNHPIKQSSNCKFGSTISYLMKLIKFTSQKHRKSMIKLLYKYSQNHFDIFQDNCLISQKSYVLSQFFQGEIKNGMKFKNLKHSLSYFRNILMKLAKHSVGLFKKSIFFYKIQCEYEQQKTISKFSSGEEGSESYIIKINEKNHRTENQQNLLLPLNSLPQQASSFIEEDSSVFIQLSKLKPVFRNQLNADKNIRIKVQESNINAGNIDSQIVDVANQNQNLSKTTDNLLNMLFYTYMAVCLIVAYIQMFPHKKL